jgi:hypothetical protein
MAVLVAVWGMPLGSGNRRCAPGWLVGSGLRAGHFREEEIFTRPLNPRPRAVPPMATPNRQIRALMMARLTALRAIHSRQGSRPVNAAQAGRLRTVIRVGGRVSARATVVPGLWRS